MYTTCPYCLSEFHVTAIHLAAEQGKVRCSICSNVFNLIEHIHDQPLATEQHKKSQGSSADTQRQQIAGASVGPAKTWLDPVGSDRVAAKKLQQKNNQGSLSYSAAGVMGRYPLAELSTPSRKNTRATVSWSVGVFLLLLAGLIQLSWFNRNYILQHYPQLNPYIQWLCAERPCTSIRQGNIDSIKLINRDVRAHPRFANALLINATMINTAAYIQPYPLIQLTLFNTDGMMIGSRKFDPQHYLDGSIVLEEGMPTNEKIHFVLEIADQASNAVSFEFRFLWQ